MLLLDQLTTMASWLMTHFHYSHLVNYHSQLLKCFCYQWVPLEDLRQLELEPSLILDLNLHHSEVDTMLQKRFIIQ